MLFNIIFILFHILISIAYYYYLREDIKNNKDDEYVEDILTAILLIVLGIVPLVNVMFVLMVLTIKIKNKIDDRKQKELSNKLLRRILFIDRKGGK